MIVTMTKAAKLAGINRTTLYRQVEQGKISASKDQDGKSNIDTAELLRRFPHRSRIILSDEDSPQDATDNVDMMQPDEHQLKREIEHLQQLLVAKDQVIEAQAQALRLLEYKTTQEPPKESTVQDIEEKNRIIEAQARLLDHKNTKKKGLFAWLF